MSIPEELSHKHQQHLQNLNARTSWGGLQQDLQQIFKDLYEIMQGHLYRISPGPLQDLLTRTCTRSCYGPWQHFTTISTRSSHKHLYKIMLRPLTAFHYDLHKIFSQSPVQHHALQGPLRGFHQDLYKIFSQDLGQDLHARTPKRSSQDHHKRTCCCWNESDKNLPRASHKSFHTSTCHHGICKIFTQGPFKEDRTSISTNFLWRTCTGSCKELVERSLEGSLEDLLIRICATHILCESAQSAVDMHMDISQEPCRPRICRKKTGAQDLDNPVTHILPEPGQSKCARIPLCVQKLLCVKYSLTLRKSFSKLLCVKAKSFSVQKLLCAKASVCKSIRVHPHPHSPSPSPPLSLSRLSLSLSPPSLSLSPPSLPPSLSLSLSAHPVLQKCRFQWQWNPRRWCCQHASKIAVKGALTQKLSTSRICQNSERISMAESEHIWAVVQHLQVLGHRAPWNERTNPPVDTNRALHFCVGKLLGQW